MRPTNWSRRPACASKSACRSIERRALAPLAAWRAMLGAIGMPPPEPGARPDHILFLRLDRRDGQDRDAGLHRHWLDPTVPFALTLAAPAHGLLVTSATLRDGAAHGAEASWGAAEARVGAPHLPCRRSAPPSPARSTTRPRPAPSSSPTLRPATSAPSPPLTGRCFSPRAAVRSAFLPPSAAGRRASADRPGADAAGIPLYAQHVDAMDNATLVDVFRAEEESCLLGTDAMRDGVDVPGRALRLVVFEKVPWPRPDILHRERRIHLAGGDPKSYDDRIARLRLRQAFGRLIRRAMTAACSCCSTGRRPRGCSRRSRPAAAGGRDWRSDRGGSPVPCAGPARLMPRLTFHKLMRST